MSLRRLHPAVPQTLALALALGLVLWCGTGVQAQPSSGQSVAAQRSSIQADRQRLEAQFDAEQATCRERFVVTACVDDVRLRRRAALAVPRARELALDDSERQSRAQARRQAVREKQLRAAEASARAPVVAASVVQRPARAAPASVARAASAAPAHDAAAEAARHVEASQGRRERATKTQQRIDGRQAERARKGQVPAPLPLPLPGGASAAR